MRRFVTAVLVFAVAGGLSLSPAHADSKDSPTAKGNKPTAKAQARDAKLIDKLAANPKLTSDSFSSECRRGNYGNYCGNYYGGYCYQPYYYSYTPCYSYGTSYSSYPYSYSYPHSYRRYGRRY